jgi:transcriptional regulator with XRE-family HTH domain
VLPEDVPRHRARGAAYPINDEWRIQIDELRQAKGWTRTKLAEEAGIAPSVLTEMLATGRKQKTSKHVPNVCRALGLPVPKPMGASDLDPVRAEIEQGLDALDTAGLSAVLAVIKQMKGPGKNR